MECTCGHHKGSFPVRAENKDIVVGKWVWIENIDCTGEFYSACLGKIVKVTISKSDEEYLSELKSATL